MSSEERASKETLTQIDRAIAILESIEEIKPPSVLKWHIIYFTMGLCGGIGLYLLLSLFVG